MEIVIMIIVVLLIDVLSLLTITGKRITQNRKANRVLLITHILLSALTYLLLLKVLFSKAGYADNRNLSTLQNSALLVIIVWFPRMVVLIFSNLGYLFRKLSTRFARGINLTGLIISAIIILMVAVGYLVGRFNFDIEEVEISYNNLHDDLDGITIVHLSDMHLSSFFRKERKLKKAIEMVNDLSPDIIINTGDFVTIAAPEMENFTSVLSKMKSVSGNYAVTGNHDEGTYHPDYTREDMKENYITITKLIKMAGYTTVIDTALTINIGLAKLSLIGHRTMGSIPDITYSEIDQLISDTSAIDFTILLSHDPNFWTNNIDESSGIDLTLSGHTHGAQVGIKKGRLRWSPAKSFYQCWQGLYGTDGCYLYVNSGLGTIGLPVRIGMPPEITLLTLKKAD